MINISELEIKEYANYKEMCAILGEEVLNGNSKKKQMADWLRYFDWEKVPHSNKILVKKIYRIPKEKDKKKRKVSLSDFNKKIETLLTIYLYEEGKPIIQEDEDFLFVKLFKYQLYNICGFGKPQLKFLMDEISEAKEEEERSKKIIAPAKDLNELFIKIFFEYAGSKLKNTLVQISKQGKIEICKDFECYSKYWHKYERLPLAVQKLEDKRRQIVKILELTESDIYSSKENAKTYAKIMKALLKHFDSNADNILEITLIKASKSDVYKKIKNIESLGRLEDERKRIKLEINETITKYLIEKSFKTDEQFNNKKLFEQGNIEDIMDDEIDLLWMVLVKKVKEYICIDEKKFNELLQPIKEKYLLKQKEEKDRKRAIRKSAKVIAEELKKDLEAIDKNVKN